MPDRYRREIEEILRQAGELGPSERPKRFGQSIPRTVWLYVKLSLGGKGWSLSPGRIMLIGGSLLLAAVIIPGMVNVSGLGMLLGFGGLLLFIIGYAMLVAKPPKIEKLWRGQPIDEPGESWWERLRRKRK